MSDTSKSLRFPEVKERTCKKCHETKPIGEFWSGGTRSYLLNICSDCVWSWSRGQIVKGNYGRKNH